MLIRRKFIRSLSSYLGGLIPHTELRFVTDLQQVPSGRLAKSTFGGRSAGDVMLPPPVGKASRFNSEGDYIVHRDQPKESRFVGRREWTRQEWDGRGQTRTVTESVDIYRDCYPRTFIPPPAIELTVTDHAGTQLAVSPMVTWQISPERDLLHIINLMLDLFGEVEVRHQDLMSFLPPQTQRVNWTLLPPGNTSAGVAAHVKGLVSKTAPTFRAPIMERLSFLASRNPAEVYLGHGGFHAYVAYVFPSTGMTVLESVMPANATYIFAGNWAAVSHFTKSQILAGAHHHARVFHDKNWRTSVAEYAN